MLIKLKIELSKNVIDHIVEAMMKGMIKQNMTENARRSMAAHKGWETRRKKAQGGLPKAL